MHFVLLTDDNNATTLVACPDQETAETVGASAIFSDGGVSAWEVPAHAVTDVDNVIQMLRDDKSCDDLLDALDAKRITMQMTTVTPDVVVERDGDTIIRLSCPKCGSADIREHDKAERWNYIEVVDGVLVVNQAQSDFETVGLVCGSCFNDLSAPENVYDAMSYL